MKWDKSKLMQTVGGKSMAMRAVETAAKVSVRLPVVVVGHDSDAIKAEIGARAEFVLQAEQRGTGHALLQATPLLRGEADLVVVFYGDMPLIRSETLQRLISAQQAAPQAALTLLTFVSNQPRGFGRIVRDEQGYVSAIVEEADATPVQRQINELSPVVYVFRGAGLWENLPKLQPQDDNNE